MRVTGIHEGSFARIAIVAVAICLALLPAAVGGPTSYASSDPRVQGGTDGAGSLPNMTPPGVPTGVQISDIATPTMGLVIDAHTRNAIAGAVVVVTNSLGELVAVTTTDSHGKFVVNLCDEPDLQVALPFEGVFGVAIHAGEALLLLVP
jgi:hypothetical protein